MCSYDNAFSPMVVGVLGVSGRFWVSWVSCCLIILVCCFVPLRAAVTMLLLQWLLGSWVSSGVFGCLGFMLSHNLVLLLCAAMTMLLLQWLLGSWVSSGVFGCLRFHVVS